MNRKKVAVAAMAAAVVALTGSCSGFAAAGEVVPDGGDGFCAFMADSVGLYDGNPVTQMGVRVGEVRSASAEGDHVRVEFTLDSGRTFPASVKAVTRSKSILADRSLELVGNYDSGPVLSEGQCIALTDTATPKSISEITGSAADFIEAVAPTDSDRQSVAVATEGLADALEGQGTQVNSLLTHAAEASANPDRLIADLGTIISTMAPLTASALENWGTIENISATLPTVLTSASDGLWPGGTNLIKGIGPLIAVLYDIQTNYGGDIWPAADVVADVLHVAATRSGDIEKLLESIPSIAQVLDSASGSAPAVRFRPPTVNIDAQDGPQTCELLNLIAPNSCSSSGGVAVVPGDRLLDLVPAVGK